jgi:hypothetical protein
MAGKTKIKWRDKPEDHDYPAARSYLSLIFPERTAARYVGKLKTARLTLFKAKDIFRASGLPLLGVGNFHVRQDQKKIQAGEKLSPLLLVRDRRNARLIIADGYHRLCAVYFYDEDADVRAKIV